MKTRELIQRIQSLYSKGAQSDDSRLSNRHIYNSLLSNRNLLVTQKLRKRQILSEDNYTILNCVAVIEVPAHSCSCFSGVGCPVYRTKERLPKILVDKSKHLIDFVMSVDNGVIINPISRQEALYQSKNRYFKGGYVFEDGYLFFTLKHVPSKIRIKFLAEDPLSIPVYSDCEENQVPCLSPLDMDFPIDGDMVESLVSLSAQNLLLIFNQMQEDKSNNSSDDHIPQRPPRSRKEEEDD